MKVIITGSNGLLGQKLIHKLREDDSVELVATSIGVNRVTEKEGYKYVSLDITNENELKKVMFENPQVIINTVCYDKCRCL